MQLQKLLLGKMIVEGHSAGRNFCCNLISASPSRHASEPLGVQCDGARRPYREELYMKVILPVAIYFAIWAVVIYGSIYFNKNVR
jgi:hypothetical protein